MSKSKKFREDILLFKLKHSRNKTEKTKIASVNVDIRTKFEIKFQIIELTWKSDVRLSQKHPDSFISLPGITKSVTIKRKARNNINSIVLYWMHDNYKKYNYYQNRVSRGIRAMIIFKVPIIIKISLLNIVVLLVITTIGTMKIFKS